MENEKFLIKGTKKTRAIKALKLGTHSTGIVIPEPKINQQSNLAHSTLPRASTLKSKARSNYIKKQLESPAKKFNKRKTLNKNGSLSQKAAALKVGKVTKLLKSRDTLKQLNKSIPRKDYEKHLEDISGRPLTIATLLRDHANDKRNPENHNQRAFFTLLKRKFNRVVTNHFPLPNASVSANPVRHPYIHSESFFDEFQPNLFQEPMGNERLVFKEPAALIAALNTPELFHSIASGEFGYFGVRHRDKQTNQVIETLIDLQRLFQPEGIEPRLLFSIIDLLKQNHLEFFLFASDVPVPAINPALIKQFFDQFPALLASTSSSLHAASINPLPLIDAIEPAVVVEPVAPAGEEIEPEEEFFDAIDAIEPAVVVAPIGPAVEEVEPEAAFFDAMDAIEPAVVVEPVAPVVEEVKPEEELLDVPDDAIEPAIDEVEPEEEFFDPVGVMNSGLAVDEGSTDTESFDSKTSSNETLLDSLSDRHSDDDSIEANPSIDSLRERYEQLLDLIDQLPMKHKIYQKARDALVDTLQHAGDQFWQNPCVDEFYQFKPICVEAMRQAEKCFTQESGIWANFFRPILRSILEFMTTIGKSLGFLSKTYQPTWFKKPPTDAEKLWRESDIALDLLGKVDDKPSGLLHEIEQHVQKVNL